MGDARTCTQYSRMYMKCTPATKVTRPPTCKLVFQWLRTVDASAKKNTVAAIIAMEMIQKEIATPSFGCKNASAGESTGFVLDIGAPMASKLCTSQDYPMETVQMA